MLHIPGVNVDPSGCSFQIDVKGLGALKSADTRTRNIESCERAVWVAHKAVKHIFGVLDSSRNNAQIVDAEWKCAVVLLTLQACSGGIKGNNVAVGSSQEAMRNHVFIRVGTRDRSLRVVAERLSTTGCRARWRRYFGCAWSIELNEFGLAVVLLLLRRRPD